MDPHVIYFILISTFFFFTNIFTVNKYKKEEGDSSLGNPNFLCFKKGK